MLQIFRDSVKTAIIWFELFTWPTEYPAKLTTVSVVLCTIYVVLSLIYVLPLYLLLSTFIIILIHMVSNKMVKAVEMKCHIIIY